MITRQDAFRRCPHRGFSLAELMIATGVMSLLAVALSSSLYLSQMSIPDNSGLSSTTVKASQLTERIYADLEYAQSVTTLNDHEVVFTLADQDGRAPTTETVRYLWSGTPGAALTREFNGQAGVVAAGVQEFTLEYDKATIAIPPGDSTGAEALLAVCDGIDFSNDRSITTTEWDSQYVIPVFSQAVHGWRVTRVVLYASTDGPATGETIFQLQLATVGRKPSGEVLSQVSLLESSLTGSFAQTSLSFAGCPTLSPSTGVCVVAKCQSNEPSLALQRWSPSSLPDNTSRLATSDAGAHWSVRTSSLRIRVYGVVEMETGATTYQYRLRDVRVKVRLGSDARSRVNTLIPIYNLPLVPGP